MMERSDSHLGLQQVALFSFFSVAYQVPLECEAENMYKLRSLMYAD